MPWRVPFRSACGERSALATGSLWWVAVVAEEQFAPRPRWRCQAQVVGEHAEEDVGADALFEAVVDRADLERALEGAEGALDPLERLVGADDLGGCELSAGALVRRT